MDIHTVIETKEQAEEFAKDWQTWQATQSLSWSEMMDWCEVFSELAQKFDLKDEFKENGII